MFIIGYITLGLTIAGTNALDLDRYEDFFRDFNKSMTKLMDKYDLIEEVAQVRDNVLNVTIYEQI